MNSLIEDGRAGMAHARTQSFLVPGVLGRISKRLFEFWRVHNRARGGVEDVLPVIPLRTTAHLKTIHDVFDESYSFVHAVRVPLKSKRASTFSMMLLEARNDDVDTSEILDSPNRLTSGADEKPEGTDRDKHHVTH